MSRFVANEHGIKVLAMPPPYKAWFALCNDPDYSTAESWDEVHHYIWEELKLPFGDSFFISNWNQQLPDQVNLTEHPHRIAAHSHDAIHTWGDFALSGKHRFTREDALSALELLRAHDIRPLVWTDHSNFIGNLMHRTSNKILPRVRDSSGHEYINDVYTMDLVKAAGIRYVWDGSLTKGVIGQDRPVGRMEWYRQSTRKYSRRTRAMIAIADKLSAPFSEFKNSSIFNYGKSCNRQYAPVRFPDGSHVYSFSRYGSWGLGDIDGLAKAIAKPVLRELSRNEGTMVLYTHLGKRNKKGADRSVHIPNATKKALMGLSDAYLSKEINISSTSTLLDYLVLRDNLKIEKSAVHFRADGIRYENLVRQDLDGHMFGLSCNCSDLKIYCDGIQVEDTEILQQDGGLLLRFPSHETPAKGGHQCP
ncbi:MAG: hypothetical protein KDI68_04715 [Gammaproteobacteria bacterium]|nr:hypothetical protein [Gammaproteobacteria bacterium]